jgi:transcription antitermination factor NusG
VEETVPAVFPWYAVHVRYQNEQRTAKMLREKGYDEFLPVYKTRRQWSDRVREVECPLFPGYVFCRFDVQNWMPIRTTPGVVSIVGIGNEPSPIEECEIAAIQAVMKGGVAAEPWPFLREGQRVRVTAGAMRGHEGLLLALKSQHRLVLSVSLLQRSVSIEIERDCVEPVL